MGDLMEIDFSKPIDKFVKIVEKSNKKECQIVVRDLVGSNSVETINKNVKTFDTGYLEMKPITLTPNNITSQLDQKDIIDNSKISINIYHSDNKDMNTEEHALIPSNNPTVSTICDKNEFEKNISSINQDLYYASLDLPNPGNTVNTRYEFKESLNNLNLVEIENEYAKINFDQPETPCSLKKNVKFQ